MGRDVREPGTLALPGTAITLASLLQRASSCRLEGPSEAHPRLRWRSKICPRSAVLRRRSSPPATPTSRSKSGCLPWDGTGNLQAVGNGGWAGSISYGAMAEALHDGYATASTDTGHVGGSGSFALGHPEKIVDFGYRSEHEMTVKAKALIEAFYRNPARMSYWNGCSTGGRQGLKEAQTLPGRLRRDHRRRARQSTHASGLRACGSRTPISRIPPATFRRRNILRFIRLC